MASGISVSGNYSQLTSRDYTRVAFEEYAKYPALYEQVAQVSTVNDGGYIREGELAGFGKFPKLTQGDALDFQIPKQGNNKTQYFTEFGLGWQLTLVMKEDDRTGLFLKMPRGLSKAAAWTREQEFWNLLNNGFVTTNDVGLDGLELFSGSHTLIDSDTSTTTYDNEATAGALSLSTLQTGLEYFKKCVGHKGEPIYTRAYWLIIPPDLEWKAQELLLSEQKPGTGDNDINVVQGTRINLKYLVVPYLTSTTAWFLLARDHDLRFIWRRNYRYEAYDDYNTNNSMHKGHMRFATTFFEPMLTYGNAGA